MRRFVVAIAGVCVFIPLTAAAAAPPERAVGPIAPDGFVAHVHASSGPSWVRDLGGTSFDSALAVTADSAGDFAIAGMTQGQIPGAPETYAGGDTDAFVARYDAAGDLLWVHEFGSNVSDHARGVALDSSGDVYVGGDIENSQAFLSKYDPAGDLLWKQKVPGVQGAIGSHANAVAFDPTDDTVYLAGTGNVVAPADRSTAHVFVAKFASDGSQVWLRQFESGRNYDYLGGVVSDQSGGVYFSGVRQSSPSSRHSVYSAYVAHLDPDGNLVWLDDLDSRPDDGLSAIATDSNGDAYLVSSTLRNVAGPREPNAGSDDIFIAKYAPTGERLWIHEFGGSTQDLAYGVAVDSTGSAYIGGLTNGALPGSLDPNVGHPEAFLVKYSATGKRKWVHELGTPAGAAAMGVAVDGSAHAYIAGDTMAQLPGSIEPYSGDWDAFIAKYKSSG